MAYGQIDNYIPDDLVHLGVAITNGGASTWLIALFTPWLPLNDSGISLAGWMAHPTWRSSTMWKLMQRTTPGLSRIVSPMPSSLQYQWSCTLTLDAPHQTVETLGPCKLSHFKTTTTSSATFCTTGLNQPLSASFVQWPLRFVPSSSIIMPWSPSTNMSKDGSFADGTTPRYPM